jgi:hypothetical protein
MQDAQWPAAVFGLGLFLTITAITVSAIWSYDSVDDALKFWSALSGLIGVITGAAVTYFFTRSAVTAANTAATGATHAANAASSAATGATHAATAAKQTVDATQGQIERLSAELASRLPKPADGG